MLVAWGVTREGRKVLLGLASTAAGGTTRTSVLASLRTVAPPSSVRLSAAPSGSWKRKRWISGLSGDRSWVKVSTPELKGITAVSLSSRCRPVVAVSDWSLGATRLAYLHLFAIEELVKLNESWWEGWLDRRLVLFASDGGGESYAFDTSADPPRILEIPDSIDPEDFELVGVSFADLLRYVRGGPEAH